MKRLCLLAIAGLALNPAAHATGPENWVVLINAESPDSIAVAQAYARLRQIPTRNLIKLPGIPAGTTLRVEDFRNKILLPSLAVIKERGLQQQIDGIAYAPGFPYAVATDADVGNKRLARFQTQPASLTGLTYLYEQVLNRDTRYLDPDANAYARKLREGELPAPFHHAQRWQGRRYLLSALLGYVGEKAETREEILARLRRSVAADGTKPKGTIYYMDSTDEARTGPRRWAFPAAVRALSSLGIKGESPAGVLPPRGASVAGAMVGAATFDWRASGATLLPGAFCDHLTSFGGVMTGAGQTLLTEFLKNGAAGACGTVTEPFNIPAKFPTAFMHVYYASGATLAEAFYQSVTSPYQQLLIGDPLCRPWGSAAKPTVTGIKPNALIKSPCQLTIKAPGASRWELYLDGQRRQSALSGKSLTLDPRGLAPGTHELRVVAVSGAPEITSRTLLSFRTP